jgi:hypothetical protein
MAERRAQTAGQGISRVRKGLGCVERACATLNRLPTSNSWRQSLLELRFFLRFSVPVFCIQFLHAIHCIVPVSSTEENPVVEPVVSWFWSEPCHRTIELAPSRERRNDLQLVKFHTIIVLTLRACLRYQPMVLAEETRRKAAEHSHQSKFVLGVCITTARVEYNVLDSTSTSKLASGLVTTP